MSKQTIWTKATADKALARYRAKPSFRTLRVYLDACNDAYGARWGWISERI